MLNLMGYQEYEACSFRFRLPPAECKEGRNIVSTPSEHTGAEGLNIISMANHIIAPVIDSRDHTRNYI